MNQDLLSLMQKHRNAPVIVFDLETNGLASSSSVLSCSAEKYILDSGAGQSSEDGPLKLIGTFERYYFSVEPENISAIRINGLSSNRIEEERAGNDWPLYFRDDGDFKEFCRDAGIIVAHNIDFDIQFVPFLKDRDQFCTMRSNTVGKFPKLSELAISYGITVDPNELHKSGYDTRLTSRIFQRMVDKIMPDLVQGELF